MKYGKMKRGWYNNRPNSNPKYESYRHRLARYGIKTTGLTNQEIKQEHELLMKNLDKKKKERFVKYAEDKPRYTWKSVYDEPVEIIRKEFKELYGKEPTMAELNDILLGGEW